MKQVFQFYNHALPAVILSTLLLAIVGYASDETVGMFEVSIGTVLVLVTSFHYLFGRGSGFFNIIFANAITIYLCFFTFFVESLFVGVERTGVAAGFLMPPAAFLLGTVLRRHDIRAIIDSNDRGNEAEFVRSFIWMLPIIAIGIFAFVVHQNSHLTADLLESFFLVEMFIISVIVVFASKDFALLLMTTGLVFKDFFSANAGLIKPAFAFFTFYSLNIVIFAAIYRIIDHISIVQHFYVRGELRDLTFVESLYFSMVTISTLGYGDIIPATNAIRFIVGAQTFLGTLLFFFGVHAILSHNRKI